METPPPPSPPSSKLARAGEAAVQVQLIRTTANIEHGGEGEGHKQVNATRVFAIFFRGLYEAPPLHGNAVKLLKLT